VSASRSEIAPESVHGPIVGFGVRATEEGEQPMRSLFARKASTAVAIVATTVAILAVMFPGLGFGDTATFHGGPPSGVFMSTEPGVCNGEDKVPNDPPVALLPTTVEVGVESHVLVYFGSMWSGLENDTKLVRKVEIFDADGFYENSPDFGANNGQVHATGTLMWTFEDIDPGTYTVEATAAVYPEHGVFIDHGSNRGANLQSCALTVFVIPVSG
jgi:hypothetical protein